MAVVQSSFAILFFTKKSTNEHVQMESKPVIRNNTDQFMFNNLCISLPIKLSL